MKIISRFLLCLFFLSGCATLPKSGNVTSMEAARIREDAAKSLSEREAQIRGIKGLATVRVGAGIFSVKGESAFALQRPRKARLEALTDLGIPQSRVLIDGDKLTIVWPMKNLYYQGPASVENLKHFLRLPLDVETLIDLLVGIVPQEERQILRRKQDWILRSDASELLVKQQEGRWLPQHYVVYDAKKRRTYEVTYSDFTDHDGFLLPNRVRARFPDSRIDLVYGDVTVNPKIQKRLFELEIPKEARSIDESR
jgi:outer membrane lipoprotein-sorting protein